MSWSSFRKFLSFTRHFLRTPTTTMRIFWKIFFFKAEPVFLAWQLWWSPGWAKHFSDRRKLEWILDFRARSSSEGPSTFVATGTSRLQWSMGPKRKTHNEVRVWLSEVSTLHRLQNQRGLKNLFPRHDVATVLQVFSCTWMCRCRIGRAAVRGQRRKAVIRDISGVDHWRLTNLSAPIWYNARRQCTVFSSRDTIIVVNAGLEKHFDGDFSPENEKEITFKRWPPGYQS